jgi:uracil-DNA glycosylase
MQSALRPRYLRALGLEVWERRRASAPRAQESLAAAPGEAPARAAGAPGPEPAEDEAWQAVAAAVAACRKCRLCETRTNTVFGVGPRDAPLMVVGEGPGADEDARGEPFVGRAGKLLDEMLRAIGRSRGSNTFIANVVKCRPPGNREPAEDEAEACRPFLEQQIRLVRPKLIVALGRVAAQRLLMTDTPIGRMRGETYQWGPMETPLIVTYHPAYLLRSPGDKAKSWEDLKRIHRFLARGAA